MKALTRHLALGLKRQGFLASVACLVVALGGGCHRKGGASDNGLAPPDAQVAENLANLSRDLRRAMPHYPLTTNFDDFVALTHVEVPPPPPGEKYAINSKWKVILVEAK